MRTGNVRAEGSVDGNRSAESAGLPLWQRVKPDFQAAFMAIERENPSPKRAVHVMLADDPVRSYETRPAPSVTAAVRSPQGYLVIELPELVRMKLEANRRHDQVHMEDLLRVGLIDAELAAALPEDLRDRLRHIRDTMEWFTEPPEF